MCCSNVIKLEKPNLLKGMYYMLEDGTIMKSSGVCDKIVEPLIYYANKCDYEGNRRVYRLRTNHNSYRYTEINLDKLIFLNTNQFEKMIKNGFKYMEYNNCEYLYRITDSLDIQIYSMSKCKFIISHYSSVTRGIISHIKNLEGIRW